MENTGVWGGQAVVECAILATHIGFFNQQKAGLPRYSGGRGGSSVSAESAGLTIGRPYTVGAWMFLSCKGDLSLNYAKGMV